MVGWKTASGSGATMLSVLFREIKKKEITKRHFKQKSKKNFFHQMRGEKKKGVKISQL